MRTLGDIREVLGTPSGAGAAVLVQASECVSREADLRLIREVLAPASVGLLSSNGRQPEEELRSLVRGLFQLSDSSLTELPDATAPLLRDVGVKSTPVLVVWNDAASVFLVASISPNRRILRQQLIAAQILLQMRE
jgi:hypothetical protein